MNPDWIEAEAKPCQGTFSWSVDVKNAIPSDLTEPFQRPFVPLTQFRLEIQASGNHVGEFKNLAIALDEFLRERGFQPKLFA